MARDHSIQPPPLRLQRVKAWWRGLVGTFRLTRPLNSASAGLMVLAGAGLWGERLAPFPEMYMACIIAVLLTAAGNIVNDYCDLDTDRINKPHRPLPQADLSPRVALLVAGGLYAGAVTIGTTITALGMAIILMVMVLSVLYSLWLKGTVLIGSCVVSALSALTVMWGPLATGRPVESLIIPAGLVFLFILTREVLKAVEDYEADRQTRITTIATVFGRRQALRVFIGLSGVTLGVSILTYPLTGYSLGYLITLLLGLDCALVYAVGLVLRSDSQESISQGLRMTKASVILGAAALLLR